MALWPSVDIIERKPGDTFDPLFSRSFDKEEEEMEIPDMEELSKTKTVLSCFHLRKDTCIILPPDCFMRFRRERDRETERLS